MTQNYQLATIKRVFNLEKHPEGGSFQECYRSKAMVGERAVATAIYFLLEKDDFSGFHRLKSDELWHFYLGGPLAVIELDLKGNLVETILGQDIGAGEKLQHLVPAGHWFGSRPLKSTEFSFVGCTVSPGFDFADFELAKREELTKLFPQHARIISELTR